MDVSLDDVSAVCHLVREVGDLWDDPTAWRTYMTPSRLLLRAIENHVAGTEFTVRFLSDTTTKSCGV